MAVHERDEQHCVVYYLRTGAAAEYDRLHEDVWPEVIDDLRERGVFDYSIFRRGDLVIGVFRTRPEVGAVSTTTVAGEVVRRWSALMSTLIERSVDEEGAELVAPRVFRMA